MKKIRLKKEQVLFKMTSSVRKMLKINFTGAQRCIINTPKNYLQLLGVENNDAVYHSGLVERALNFHLDVLLFKSLSEDELVIISSLVLN